MDTVKVSVDRDVDFNLARKMADVIADDGMLVSWFDGKKGTHFPDVKCCGEDSWLVYGKSRGGSLLIEINEYKFLYIK
ncbi:hypothetical protein Asulf_01294 [Archaeoglobus sulfaticallidus PM70-1]|uniref:DUF5619 domain-containing protein n=1 Tax=Archaeoglobus sulfaticallidus PM70-1 TaxID=387631 RepID=N0BE46_9EURY|nr:AF1514 family protein [Archaeoglobus sulfaticallidus]AGK61288.1 hypothetical protein Asulf_01294 [Archaeoglobus sulfaticallidus PM70-1]